MSELKEELEQVLDNLKDNIEDFTDDKISQLIEAISAVLKDNPLSIIKRASDFFPIGGYVTQDRCYAQWLDDNVVEFYIEGWKFNLIKYKYIGGYYYKIYSSSGNVNGKGQFIQNIYENSIALSEDQVLYEISKIPD